MDPPSSKLTPPSPSTSTIPSALQHSPSPPPLQRSGTGSGQRGKFSPMRRTSGLKFTGRASTSPTALKDALDQKEEVKRLAQRLSTRLQYAVFKVERGWTKHSLPEVENLYWRATKVVNPVPSSTVAWKNQSSPREKVLSSSSSGASSAMARESSHGSVRPAIVRLPSQSKGVKRPRAEEEAEAVARGAASGQEDVDEDVFGSSVTIARPAPATSRQHAATTVIGLNGLPTPPPSAGTDLDKVGSASSASSTVGKGLLADLRVSPTRQMQAVRAAASRGQTVATSRGRAGSSYADFWDKLGSSSPAAGARGGALVRDEGSGPIKGAKRLREDGNEGRRASLAATAATIE